MAIGRIVVDLLARTGSFDTDLDRSGKLAARKAKEIDEAFKRSGQAVGAGLAAATLAVAAWTRSTIQQSEEIVRLAALSGTTADEFQRLAAGAELVGIGQDKLSDIFKDAQDKIGDFLQNGAGPMKDFFDNIAPQIGVTADEFRNLSGPQALGLYVKSLQQAGISQAEMVFYMEAIANDATLLLPLLKDNAQGFKDAGDQAARMSAILSDETIAASMQLRRDMVLLDRQFEGVKNRIMADLMPSLGSLVTELQGTAEQSRLLDEAAQIGATGIRILATTAIGVGSAFMLAGEAIATTISALSLVVQGEFKAAVAALELGAEEVESIIGRTAELMSSVWDTSPRPTPALPAPATSGGGGSRASNPIQKISDDAKKAQDDVKRLIDGLETEIARFGKNPAQIAILDAGDAGATIEQLDQVFALAMKLQGLQEDRESARAHEAATEALRTQADAWLDSIDPMREFLRNIEQIDKAVAAGFLNPEQAERIKASLSGIGEKLSEMDEFALEAARNIQDALGQGLYDILDGNFDNIGDAFADMLKRMAAEAMAADLARTFFGDFAKSGKVGGMAGEALSWIGGLFGGARANGGPVTGGMTYLVGERGPELFTPSTSGAVLPNHVLGQGGRSVVINQTNHFSGNVDRSQMFAYAQQIKAATIAELRDAQARGETAALGY
jgi:hypothetical protein